MVPMIVVGNKADRVLDREVSTAEGLNLARHLRCDYIETSAKTAQGVEKAFYSVVRLIRRQRNHDSGIQIPTKKKNKCLLL
nr:tRNA A64-2'-O-ribosylphosphate transferase [Polyrhizophydium stewartii]